MLTIHSAVPILPVADVQRSVGWYSELFGFSANTFPTDPPFSFAILMRDRSELMLQRATITPSPSDAKPPYAGWTVYFRIDGGDLLKLFESVKQKWSIVRAPERMFYNIVEFEIDDPDGHRLVFGEGLGPEVDVPLCRG